jgi:hypothetical protein
MKKWIHTSTSISIRQIFNLKFIAVALLYIPYLTLTGITPLYGQDCTDCGSRTVGVYNLKTSGMSPTAGDHAAILNFYNALMIGSSITRYLSTADPSRDCIGISGYDLGTLDTNWALQYPSYLAKTAENLKESPSGFIPDYWIGGTIVPTMVDLKWVLFYQFDLHTANNEVVTSASGNVDFYPTGNVYSMVSNSMAVQMSPMYQKMHEFEIKKRNTGSPYAINPSLSCTWKKQLDFAEKTTIHFKFTDCDGEVLKNRDVTIVECDLGTLDKMAFTTDVNGEADLQYTAPVATAGIAYIQISYSYTEPWAAPENQKTKEGLVEIEIKTPPDSWSLYATYSFTESGNSRKSESSGLTAAGQTHDAQSNRNSAWIKKMEIPNTPPYYFVAEVAPLAAAFSGHSTSRGQYGSFTSNSVGYIKGENWYNYFADVEPTAEQSYNISINDKKYSFRFEKLDAAQYGMYHNYWESYEPVGGLNTSSFETPPNPKTILNWNTNGFVGDTSYSIHTTNDIDDSREYITQTCTWNDTLFLLNRNENFILETTNEVSVGNVWIKEYSKTIGQRRISIEMKYNKGTPSVVEGMKQLSPIDFALSQNYPNPFNPITIISYQLPMNSHVLLSVYDALGREVATLVNEIKEAGSYTAQFDGSKFSRQNAGGLASGIYFYTLRAGNFSETKKLLLMK